VLGRKNYTPQEVEHGKSAVEKQLAVYRQLVGVAANGTADRGLESARDDCESVFFNNMTLALDRRFVHRLKMVTGKDCNPLNEVELICDSLMNNDGILRGNNVVKYVPEAAVVKLKIGDPIRLSAEHFERLSAAFFAELERRFL
jgi:hypothetical protein